MTACLGIQGHPDVMVRVAVAAHANTRVDPLPELGHRENGLLFGLSKRTGRASEGGLALHSINHLINHLGVNSRERA
jgi:hypothetical protein